MRSPTPCSATTRAGNPCGFSARNASGLCINHDPAYRERQAENTQRGLDAANRVRRARARKLTYEQFNLVGREQVQALLDTVIRLELEGRISGQRSRNLIRAASLAMRNLAGEHILRAPGYTGSGRPYDNHPYRVARADIDRWITDLDRIGAFDPEANDAH